MSKAQTASPAAASAPKPTSPSDAKGQATGDASKPFWASQTVWSSIAVVGASAAGAWFAWRDRDLEALAVAITAVLGGLNAIVGRFRADVPLR
jgi:hypothetical protein